MTTTKAEKTPKTSVKPEEESADKKKKAAPEMATLGEIRAHMSRTIKVIWWLGAICSFFAGIGMPTFAIVFGQVLRTFDPRNGDLNDLME